MISVSEGFCSQRCYCNCSSVVGCSVSAAVAAADVDDDDSVSCCSVRMYVCCCYCCNVVVPVADCTVLVVGCY